MAANTNVTINPRVSYFDPGTGKPTRDGLLLIVSLNDFANAISDTFIAQTITNGDTEHAPSGEAVFEALALKATTAALTAGLAGKQDLDGDLTAIAALGSTGLAARTAANTWAQRSIGVPAAGLSITNPAGVAGDPTLALANDLAALEALASTGIPQRTGTDTWSLLTYADITSWTPAITFATAGDLSVTYTSQVGGYVRIGSSVFVWFNLLTSAFTFTTASGLLQITGLPFTSNNTTGYTWEGPLVWQGITKAGYTDMAPQLVVNSTAFNVIASQSGAAASGVTAANMPTGGTVLLRSAFWYAV